MSTKGEAAKEYDVGEAPAVCKRLVINAQTGEIEPYLIENKNRLTARGLSHGRRYIDG